MSNTLTELQPLQTSGIDYDTVLSELEQIIKNNPNWSDNWTSFYNSEAGTLFLQLMAYISDNISIRQDTLYNEMFISTAQKDKDKLRLLHLINYTPKYAVASKVYLTFELSELNSSKTILTPSKAASDTYASRPSKILKITGKDINGNDATFEVIREDSNGKPDYIGGVYLNNTTKNDGVSFSADSSGNSIYALQGTTSYTTFTSSTSDGPYFDIKVTGIANDSIKIYDVSTGSEHYEVDNFLQKEARDTSYGIPYVLEYTEEGYTRIRYGSSSFLSNTNRRFQAGHTIGVFYRTCSGSTGNIPAKFIDTDFSVYDETGSIVTGIVYNPSIGINGSDAETVSEASENGPLSIRTMNRAVTPEDYDTILGEYGTMYKYKSYSATNQPSGFYNYYGRYINPQEVFSFVMLKKDYSDVPASEYNNYPWIDLKKNAMFNEKYVFDSAEYNKAVTASSMYGKLTVTTSSSNPVVFNNAVIVDVGSDFDGAVATSKNSDGTYVYNSKLKLKMHNKEYDESYFANIPYTVLSSDLGDADIEESKSIVTTVGESDDTTTKFITQSFDDNARYISNKGITRTKLNGKYYSFIDCKSYDKITFYLDGKGAVDINLDADKNNADNDGSLASTYEKYYICISNGTDNKSNYKTLIQHDGYGWTGTESDALYRRSLVELVNQQMVELSQVSVASNINLYNSLCSVQYLGLDKTSSDGKVNNIAQGTNIIIKINGSYYKFQIARKSGDTYDETTISGISSIIDKCLASNSGGMYTYDVYSNGWSASTDLDGLRCTCTSPSVGVYDIAFYSTKASNLSDGKIIIEDATDASIVGTDTSLFKGFGITSMPDVIEAASYSTVASAKTDTTKGMQYFEIRSPISGESSSIYFKKQTNDLLGSVFGLSYNSNGFSNIAYGLRSVTIFRNDTLVAMDTTDTESTLSSAPKMGNLIISFNSVNIPYDFDNIYASYKLKENSELLLGSVYDNYYLTGDTDKDDASKPMVFGIEGQYVDSTTENGTTTYTVNEDMSDFNVKLTTSKIDTNSINCITSDISAVKMERASLKSANITSLNGNDVPLLFGIDDMTTFGSDGIAKLSSSSTFGSSGISLSGCSTGYSVYDAVKNALVSISNDTKETVKTYSLYEGKFDFGTTYYTDSSGSTVYPVTVGDIIKCSTIAIASLYYKNSSGTYTALLSTDVLSNIDYYSDSSGTTVFDPTSIDISSLDICYVSSEQSVSTNSSDAVLYAKNYGLIIKRSIANLNQIVFGNITKNEGSNITFYCPSSSSEEDASSLYKSIFGTSITNPEFYLLYPEKSLAKNSSGEYPNLKGNSSEYWYAPTKAYPLTFKYRVINSSNESVAADYYISVGSATKSGVKYPTFTLIKTSGSNFQDAPFYVHLVNDRTYEVNASGDLITTEEDVLQDYMDGYKISGMDLTFVKPYFKTFDVAATITYNANYSYVTVKSAVETALKEAFGIDGMDMAKSVSKSKVFKTIMKINGVESCSMTYFGLDYTDQTTYPNQDYEISADFYEYIVLHENVSEKHGLILTYEQED